MQFQKFVMALSLAAATALPAWADEPDACTRFHLEDDSTVQIEIGKTTVTVDDRGDKATFDQIISKRFGRLVSAMVENSDADAAEHYFQIADINGARSLIFDSQIFVPACN